MKRNPVITRIWHGKTQAIHAEEYMAFLEKTAVPDYKSTPGNLSVQILRMIDGEVCHFWTITRWKNLESIIAFAGENYLRAKYYPEDTDFLVGFEPEVIHCETFDY